VGGGWGVWGGGGGGGGGGFGAGRWLSVQKGQTCEPSTLEGSGKSRRKEVRHFLLKQERGSSAIPRQTIERVGSWTQDF